MVSPKKLLWPGVGAAQECRNYPCLLTAKVENFQVPLSVELPLGHPSPTPHLLPVFTWLQMDKTKKGLQEGPSIL